MRSMMCVLGLIMATALDAAENSRIGDEVAIRALVRSYVEARTSQDPKTIEALFTADADQHTTSGEWRRGRHEVVPGTLRSSAAAPGTRRIEIENIRFVSEDVAIADGPYTIGEGAAMRRNWTTLVLKREAGTWRISAIRNMSPTGNAAR